jgi:hypothetical protein
MGNVGAGGALCCRSRWDELRSGWRNSAEVVSVSRRQAEESRRGGADHGEHQAASKGTVAMVDLMERST